MSYQRNLISLLVFILAMVLSLAGLTWANSRLVQDNTGGRDFYLLWNASNSWTGRGISPYQPSVAQEAYRTLQGREPIPTSKANQYSFLSPLYAMAVLFPFSLRDIGLARTLWMTLLEGCLVGTALLGIKLSGWKIPFLGIALVLLFALIGYYNARAVILGSFAPVCALLVFIGLSLIQSKRDMDAGLVLALATADLHLAFPLVLFTFFWSISVRRSRIALGISIGIVFLIISSMVFLPDWPLQWAREMLAYLPMLGTGSSVISRIANQLPGISRILSLILYAVVALYMLGEWITALGRSERWFQWTALLTLTLSLMFPLRSTSSDYVILLPVLFLLFRAWQERWGKFGEISAWVLLGLLFVGTWAYFYITFTGLRENAVLVIVTPLLSLIGLWWVRWWAIHRQRLFFEEYPL